MSKIFHKSLLIITITIVYIFYFYCSCIIIPYPTKDDKRIVFIHYIYPIVENEEKFPVNTKADTDKDSAHIQYISRELEVLTDVLQGHPDQPYANTQAEGNATTDSIKVTRERLLPDSGRQGHSRILLSGSKAVKALTALSFKDKLWLVKLLGRCSMEELIKIKDMLQDGVTYEENLSMYKILRRKVTDSEQKRLDTLIEAYTK